MQCNFKNSHQGIATNLCSRKYSTCLSVSYRNVHDVENAVIILILLVNSIRMKEHNKIQMRKEIDSLFLHVSLFTVSQYSPWRARREHFSLLRILPIGFDAGGLKRTKQMLTRLSRIGNFMTPKKE